MKIAGVDPTTLVNEYVLPLPRGKDHLVFRAVGLKTMDEFHKLCPTPEPPRGLRMGKVEVQESDPDYQEILKLHSQKQMAYMVIFSLLDIEWDTVRVDDPKTWVNWRTDLMNAGLTEIECGRVLNLVLEANCLDERKLEEARKSFLLGQQKAA